MDAALAGVGLVEGAVAEGDRGRSADATGGGGPAGELVWERAEVLSGAARSPVKSDGTGRGASGRSPEGIAGGGVRAAFAAVCGGEAGSGAAVLTRSGGGTAVGGGCN